MHVMSLILTTLSLFVLSSCSQVNSVNNDVIPTIEKNEKKAKKYRQMKDYLQETRLEFK